MWILIQNRLLLIADTFPFLSEKAAGTSKALDLCFKSRFPMNFMLSCEDCDKTHSPPSACHFILPFVAQPCIISPFYLLSCFQSSSVIIDLSLSPFSWLSPSNNFYGRFQSLFQFLLLQRHILVLAISALTYSEHHFIPGENERQDGGQKKSWLSRSPTRLFENWKHNE